MTAYDNSDIAVAGGDVIFSSDLNDVTARIPRTYVKASTTSRNTTTTYANDSELASIPLEVGTFEIELVGFFSLSTTTTQKIKTNWAFTGTWNTPVRACLGPGSSQTADRANVTEMQTGGYAATGQDAIYDTSTSSGYSVFREIARNVTVTVAGNLSLQWAQSASSGNNTNLQPGTSFTIRKMA